MYADEFPKAIIDTLYMLIVSGFISAVIGIFLGVIVVVTRKGGILENKVVFWILDKIINLFRDPFHVPHRQPSNLDRNFRSRCQ